MTWYRRLKHDPSHEFHLIRLQNFTTEPEQAKLKLSFIQDGTCDGSGLAQPILHPFSSPRSKWVKLGSDVHLRVDIVGYKYGHNMNSTYCLTRLEMSTWTLNSRYRLGALSLTSWGNRYGPIQTGPFPNDVLGMSTKCLIFSVKWGSWKLKCNKRDWDIIASVDS